jgi:hypothetical protein
LSGQDARQVFFSNSHLSVDEGYKILMGAVSRLGSLSPPRPTLEFFPGPPNE